MNIPRFRIVAVLCVIVLLSVVAIWMLLPPSVPKTDEERFQRWQRTNKLWVRTYWWERHLPTQFVRLFNLRARENKYSHEGEDLRLALLQSGYFTNLVIAMAAPTNIIARRKVAAQKLNEAFQGREEWEFYMRSNAIVITCRTRDMDLCIRAIKN